MRPIVTCVLGLVALPLLTGCSTDVTVSEAVNLGRVRVTTRTTGFDFDPDGYQIMIGAGHLPSFNIQVGHNQTIAIPYRRIGDYTVELRGVAPNCTIDGAARQTVTIRESGETVDVEFSTVCTRLGSIVVIMATTGVDHDPDGYAVAVQGVDFIDPANAAAPTTGTITVPRLAAGVHTVSLVGVAANCDTSEPAAKVNVVSGDPVPVMFNVVCTPVTQLVFASSESPERIPDIYVMNVNGTGMTRITNHEASDQDPVWSPDGRRIAFASNRGGSFDIYVMDANGSNVVRLTTDFAAQYQPAWSPDGSRIAYVSEHDGNAELFVMNADGTNVIRLTSDPAVDTDPAWSPDGRRIAFTSTRNGFSQIYVMNADASGAIRLTNESGDSRQPAWSPDGSMLAFSRLFCASSAFVSSCYPAVFVTSASSSASTLIGVGEEPTWSPDGKKIAVTNVVCDSYYYYYTAAPCQRAGISILSVHERNGARVPTWNAELTKGSQYNPSWRW